MRCAYLAAVMYSLKARKSAYFRRCGFSRSFASTLECAGPGERRAGKVTVTAAAKGASGLSTPPTTVSPSRAVWKGANPSALRSLSADPAHDQAQIHPHDARQAQVQGKGAGVARPPPGPAQRLATFLPLRLVCPRTAYLNLFLSVSSSVAPITGALAT